MDELISTLDPESLDMLRTMPKDDLVQYHHGWGTDIRNVYGLWGGNPELMASCGRRHPDDCSMVIMEAVWDSVHEQMDP